MRGCTFIVASITGSIISSTILKPPVGNNENDTVDYSKCGANDCPWYNVTAVEAKPDDTTVGIHFNFN